MTALEIYKLLPRNNCGECDQKLCLPFAFAVAKGEIDVSKCVLLKKEAVDIIKNSLKVSNWHKDSISRLMMEVSNINFSEIAEGIGAEFKEGCLKLQYLNKVYTIDHNGEVMNDGEVKPLVKILILTYLRGANALPLSDKWVSFSELKNGMLKYHSFLKECEERLNNFLTQSLKEAESLLEKLGAKREESISADYAWKLNLLPKIPIIISFWMGEDEIPSETKILFDSTTDRFLDIESLFFLVREFLSEFETLKATL